MSRNSPKAYLATIYHIVYQEMVGLFEGIINEAFVLRNYSPGYYSNAYIAFHNIFSIGNNYLRLEIKEIATAEISLSSIIYLALFPVVFVFELQS